MLASTVSVSFVHILITLIYIRHVASEYFETDYVPKKDGNRLLSNGKQIPLVGMGLRCLEDGKIASIVSLSLGSEYGLGYRLIDTNMIKKSANENLISEVISKTKFSSKTNQVHIMTHVLYTHLGYERTKSYVKSLMGSLLENINSSIDLRVHVMLSLPQSTRYDKSSVKESWKALEDFYSSNHPNIQSIGVSNFNSVELNSLLKVCRIKPHVAQATLGTLFEIWPHLRQHNIVGQAHGIYDALTNAKDTKAYEARMLLRQVAGALSVEVVHTPASVLVSYLSNKGISMIPCTGEEEYLIENSPEKVSPVPKLNAEQKKLMDGVINFILMRASTS